MEISLLNAVADTTLFRRFHERLTSTSQKNRLIWKRRI
ncbi:hypothetical protein F0726_02704 [Acidithiobacillus caldus]|nr:hypothetical protein F0726_02704 [Acidithiobacillus caldus]